VNQRITWLGVLTVCGLLVLLVSIIVIPRWLYRPLSAADLRGVASPQVRIQLQQAQSQLASDARSSILQGLAGVLVVIGAIATWRQVHISREGQITDRFTRAVDQLGSRVSDVRIGALYALERIARNSPADRDHIQYLLGAYIRTRMPWPGCAAASGSLFQPQSAIVSWLRPLARLKRGVGPKQVARRAGWAQKNLASSAGTTSWNHGAATGSTQHPTPTLDENLPWMRVRAPDIQAAMGVLGRRPPSRDEPTIYLSRVDLRSIALRRARLNGAKLRYANLARAVLEAVWLERSDLTAADLRRAFLEGAHLNGANLSRAYLQGANLRRADLSNANLQGANLADTILDGTVLRGAQADQATIWPAGFDAGRRQELGISEARPQPGPLAGRSRKSRLDGSWATGRGCLTRPEQPTQKQHKSGSGRRPTRR
jgi:hypothetical protein